MRNQVIVFVLLLMLSFSCLSQQKSVAKPKSAAQPSEQSTSALPSEDEVNAFLHATFGYDPQLTWKILSIKPSEAKGLAEVNVAMSSPQGQGTQRFFVSEDRKHAVVGDIIPFGVHPFDETRLELQKNVSGPVRGPANAPVLLVEFSDLQCPHCKEANPTVERLLKEDSDVRFVFQNFPLSSHNWAQKAAEYADCVGRASNDAFWKFIDSVYAAQDGITADNADQKLTELSDQAGVKGADIAACTSKPETQSRVEASIKLGQSLDVNSTPTLFINGRPVGVNGNNYDVLKQLVDFAAKEK
ncbi:MAG TPA: thioredoxin domain-containing protein [Terriglobales bacterium]|nr:thioredoxin domain-containing protein [Terriglobales bacterium]